MKKPVKGWMAAGPRGLAPYYPWDFTRKSLKARIEERSPISRLHGLRLVKVIIQEVE